MNAPLCIGSHIVAGIITTHIHFSWNCSFKIMSFVSFFWYSRIEKCPYLKKHSIKHLYSQKVFPETKNSSKILPNKKNDGSIIDRIHFDLFSKSLKITHLHMSGCLDTKQICFWFKPGEKD